MGSNDLVVFSILCCLLRSALNFVAFIVGMIFSMRKQKQDEERITLTYTRSHLLKLILAGLNLLACLILFIVDLVMSPVGFIIENTTYTCVWMFSIMLLRREFLKTGQTSVSLLCLWSFLLLTPSIMLILEVTKKVPSTTLHFSLISLIVLFNFLLVIVTSIRRVDIGDIYSRTSSVYNQMMKSYFLEDESLEDEDQIWDKLDKLADESIPLIERENIKSITVKPGDSKDWPEGRVHYFAIEVTYGKTKNLSRTVLRRFREFIIFFIDMKSANSSVQFSEFPGILQIKEQVTPAVLSQRVKFFNDFFQVILKNKLNSPLFSKFLSLRVAEVAHPNQRLRTFSCVQEIPVEVQLSKAFRKSSRFLTKANYEIVVSSGAFFVKTFHLFDEFKDLRKRLRKRHAEIDELPANHILKSSANPEVVKERKGKLRNFLQNLVENNDTKVDKDLVGFLNIDKIYFSNISE